MEARETRKEAKRRGTRQRELFKKPRRQGGRRGRISLKQVIDVLHQGSGFIHRNYSTIEPALNAKGQEKVSVSVRPKPRVSNVASHEPLRTPLSARIASDRIASHPTTRTTPNRPRVTRTFAMTGLGSRIIAKITYARVCKYIHPLIFMTTALIGNEARRPQSARTQIFWAFTSRAATSTTVHNGVARRDRELELAFEKVRELAGDEPNSPLREHLNHA